jgi:hypothetical protein
MREQEESPAPGSASKGRDRQRGPAITVVMHERKKPPRAISEIDPTYNGPLKLKDQGEDGTRSRDKMQREFAPCGNNLRKLQTVVHHIISRDTVWPRVTTEPQNVKHIGQNLMPRHTD